MVKILERRVETIKLSPHHMELILTELALGNFEETLERQFYSSEQFKGYGDRSLENEIQVYRAILRHTPIKGVLRLDDICRACGKKHNIDCRRPEPDIFYFETTFGMKADRSMPPLDMLANGIKHASQARESLMREKPKYAQWRRKLHQQALGYRDDLQRYEKVMSLINETLRGAQ